jgi:hypothetical protein
MKSKAEKATGLARHNAACAKAAWPSECSKSILTALRELTTRFGFSVSMGEIRLLSGRWYVTNSGLLHLARRLRCQGIVTRLVPEFSDPTLSRWVFKAIVYKSARTKGFVGFADADPSNVSPLVRGAELRMSETRAVNRALRKAYGIGLCSVEELGYLYSAPEPSTKKSVASNQSYGNGSSNGQPRLRDRLCLLIRQYHLDPTLVKRYAADFCGTQELREASRDLVESFIDQLAAAAKSDLAGLISKLDSYAQPAEVKP